ncbi:Hpt domain-containing protein [Bradymonas sediminis]|nr:Hpt domain-containing protein [Bradymonas sediminis]TDP75794.1 HPt (histidine-containing phosphotransfer) domain-containing protein [Bradymonas sediminis]
MNPNTQPPAPKPALDWDEALKRVAGSQDTLVELVEIFIQQWPQIMDEIEQGVARQDYVTLHRAAHTLKGSASIFGAKPVVEASDRLAEMGKNETTAGAEDALRYLQDELDRLLPELQTRLQ